MAAAEPERNGAGGGRAWRVIGGTGIGVVRWRRDMGRPAEVKDDPRVGRHRLQHHAAKRQDGERTNTEPLAPLAPRDGHRTPPVDCRPQSPAAYDKNASPSY